MNPDQGAKTFQTLVEPAIRLPRHARKTYFVQMKRSHCQEFTGMNQEGGYQHPFLVGTVQLFCAKVLIVEQQEVKQHINVKRVPSRSTTPVSCPVSKHKQQTRDAQKQKLAAGVTRRSDRDPPGCHLSGKTGMITSKQGPDASGAAPADAWKGTTQGCPFSDPRTVLLVGLMETLTKPTKTSKIPRMAGNCQVEHGVQGQLGSVRQQFWPFP